MGKGSAIQITRSNYTNTWKTALYVDSGFVSNSVMFMQITVKKGKGKVIPLQARCGPEGG